MRNIRDDEVSIEELTNIEILKNIIEIKEEIDEYYKRFTPPERNLKSFLHFYKEKIKERREKRKKEMEKKGI